ncbi:MAG: hypothetical protein ACHQFW_07980, partial [Chitinophagales bacterium]
MRNHIVFFLFTTLLLNYCYTQTGCISGDCLNGEGVYVFETQEKYSGSFENGAITGLGIYEWPNGSWYVGYFNNSVFDGYGTYSVNDSVLDGFFIDGVYSGAEDPMVDYFLNDGINYDEEEEYIFEDEDYDEEEYYEENEYADENTYIGQTPEPWTGDDDVLISVINSYATEFNAITGDRDYSFEYGDQYYSTASFQNSGEAVI